MTNTITASYAALVLRVSLGIMYLAHAWLKLKVFTLAGTAQFFISVGFPAELAYVVTFAELIGGVLLIMGVQTRWVALALIPVLLGAASVHSHNGWLHTNQGGGWEYPVFLVAASVVQFLLGDGSWAFGASRKKSGVTA